MKKKFHAHAYCCETCWDMMTTYKATDTGGREGREAEREEKGCKAS